MWYSQEAGFLAVQRTQDRALNNPIQTIAAPANQRRFRTFVLGAGFSAAAGLPLATGLWHEVLRRIDRAFGQDNIVRHDLARFLRFKQATVGLAPDANAVDFEEFLGFLDIEHYLWLQGSDTWSAAGNRGQLIIRWFIGQTLFERQQEGRARRPEVYRRFAAELRGSDYVMTFNYDTLVEESLEAVGRPYRLFPNRFEEIRVLSNTVDSSRDDVEVVVLKLHGSIDWFDRSGFDDSVAVHDQFTDAVLHPHTADTYRRFPPRHPVFGRENLVTPEPLLEGPQSPDDPLNRIWRVRDPAPLYDESAFATSLLGSSPFLLTPSHQKLLYAPTLVGFWNGLGRSGGGLGVAIIGFSLPPHDAYALQALYGLTRNYTESWYDENHFGWLKLPLRLVDLQQSEELRSAYRERFRFVNWERAESYLDGFSERALQFLFRESRGGYQPLGNESVGTEGEASSE